MTFEDYRRWRDNEEEPDEPSYLSQDRIFSKGSPFERDDEEYRQPWTPPERPNLASDGLFDFGTTEPTLVASRSQQMRQHNQKLSNIDVATLSGVEKLGEAVNRAAKQLPEEIAEQLKAIFTPAALATMAAVLAIYIASHATGVGQVADVAMIAVGGFYLGVQAFGVIKDLIGFASALNAETDADLDEAGECLARAITTVGIDVVMTLLTKKVAGKIKNETTTKKVASHGRNTEPLTPAQIDEVKAYAKELGIPEGVISYTDGNTAYGNIFGQEMVKVGPDIVPHPNPPQSGITANSRISLKGSLAHEWIGHGGGRRAGKNHQTNFPNSSTIDPKMEALEEAQASIRAARFAPNLTPLERYILLRDGINRLRQKGIKIREVRHLLYIDKP